MRKIISIFLALVLVFSVTVVTVSADDITVGKDDSTLNVPGLGLFGDIGGDNVEPQGNVKYYDGTKVIHAVDIDEDTYAIDYIAPAKTGYYFVGWYTDAALKQPSNGSVSLKNVADGNWVSLYAKYIAYPSVLNLDLTKYSLSNNAVTYGYLTDTGYKTGILNKGYATKEYTNNGITVYSTGYNKAGTDNSGNAYAKDTSSWAQTAPIIITNADGTAFVPKANTKYNITINYSCPSHGKATAESLIVAFSGMHNDYVNETSMKDANREDVAETLEGRTINLSTAFSGTKSTTITITTENFDGHVPVLGLFVRAAGAKISETKTTYSGSSTGYKVESISKIIISSISVCEAQTNNQLKVTQIVRNEADVLTGTAQIFLPEDNSQAYKVKQNFIGYAMAVFTYDADKQSYVLTENYVPNANKQGVTIPAGSFAYIIKEASNGYWANLQASYKLLTGGEGLESTNIHIIGSEAYLYGADFDIPYISTNKSNSIPVTSAQFMTNAFISLGETVTGKTHFDPTNDAAKLFGGGASVLTPDAYELANNEQALRVYFKYKANDDGTVLHKGENVEVAERGILIKSASKNVDLTIENMNHNSVTVVKSTDFTKCWNYDSASGILTYSNHITKFVDELRQKDLVFRPYLKLENGEYVLGDEVTYNVDSVESMASEWTADFILSGGRQLVWSNEFTNETSLDATGFNYSDITTDNPLANYTKDGSNIRFENGTMSIVTKPDEDADKVFSSSVISTFGKVEFKYGYLEMRAKVPFDNGCWPAFWMKSDGMAQTYSTYYSEVDIFEVFGSTTTLKATLHKWGPWTSSGTEHAQYDKLKKYSFADNATALGWHTYGLEWNETTMGFYIDGICYTSVRIDSDFNTSTLRGMKGFHDYHFIILSSGLYTGEHKTNETGFFYTKENFNKELTFTLDYIRLYQNPAKGEDLKIKF